MDARVASARRAPLEGGIKGRYLAQERKWSSSRAIRDRPFVDDEIIKTYVDDKTVFWLDIGHVFLNDDGTMKKELMPDCLHPNIPGYRVWAEAMEPTIKKILGEP